MTISLPLCQRLLLSVIGAVAIALLVLIGAFNLVLRERLRHEADNTLSARASAELASLHVVGGRLAAPEVPDSGAPDTQAWVFASAHSLLEQPRADPATVRAAEQLAADGRHTEDPPGTSTRLYAVPVILDRRRLGTVVTAISLTPYRSTPQTALIASIVLGVALLAAAALAAKLLISAALRPVATMTAQAAAWSQDDAAQRFSLGPPRDELTQLAATLDDLLDRLAISLRHEQRFTAELSHELRSPLASVIAEAQLALRHSATAEQYRAAYERILTAAQQMRRTLDALLAAARIEHRPSPPVVTQLRRRVQPRADAQPWPPTMESRLWSKRRRRQFTLAWKPTLPSVSCLRWSKMLVATARGQSTSLSSEETARSYSRSTTMAPASVPRIASTSSNPVGAANLTRRPAITAPGWDSHWHDG